MKQNILVTGSSGLIGSEVVSYFAGQEAEVHGADNNQRADFFGPGDDTRWNQQRSERELKNFKHHELNIRKREQVLHFIAAFLEKPRSGEIYNLGGGRGNSCSILEAFAATEKLTGKKMQYEYVDKNREGDHICYISDLRKMKDHYPNWKITKSLGNVFREIVLAWKAR